MIDTVSNNGNTVATLYSGVVWRQSGLAGVLLSLVNITSEQRRRDAAFGM